MKKNLFLWKLGKLQHFSEFQICVANSSARGIMLFLGPQLCTVGFVPVHGKKKRRSDSHWIWLLSEAKPHSPPFPFLKTERKWVSHLNAKHLKKGSSQSDNVSVVRRSGRP